MERTYVSRRFPPLVQLLAPLCLYPSTIHSNRYGPPLYPPPHYHASKLKHRYRMLLAHYSHLFFFLFRFILLPVSWKTSTHSGSFFPSAHLKKKKKSGKKRTNRLLDSKGKILLLSPSNKVFRLHHQKTRKMIDG